MSIYKRVCAFFLISFSFACTAVLAMWVVTITPMVLDIEPGESVVFTATPLGASWSVTYEWYIDWLVLSGVTTSSLSLDWTGYSSLFPADITSDSARAVTVVATDSVDSATWSATLLVTHSVLLENATWGDNYCGDWIVRTDLWESCDDANRILWDWCDRNCWCEAWWTCSVDIDGTTSIMTKDPEEVDDAWDRSWDNNAWPSDDDDDKEPKKSLVEKLAEKNKKPLTLSDSAPSNWYMPKAAPETGASLDALRLLRPIAPKAAVAHPAVLPRTGPQWIRVNQPRRLVGL